MTLNRLYLVRHGENYANLTKEFSYRLVDYPLTDKGISQAEQTAGYFIDKNIHAVFSSPLKRALQTAQIIAGSLGLEVTVMENFREVNVGTLEGQPVSPALWEQNNRIWNDWFNRHPESSYPGGENYFTLWQRTREGLHRVLEGKNGKNLLIVGHGGIFTSTLREYCQGIDGVELSTTPNHNCSISEIWMHQHNGTLEGELIAWASCDHLTDEAAELIPGTPPPEFYTSQP